MPYTNTFYHWLIDSYLERWQIRNPNSKPFVSIKIFKFNPTKIKNNINYNLECKEDVKIQKKKITKINKTLTHHRVYKPKNKDSIHKEYTSTVETTEKIDDIKVSYEYVPAIKTDDIECSIETFDSDPDASIDILKVQTTGYIDHQQIIKMPTNKLVLCNYDEDEKKGELSGFEIINSVSSAKSIEVNYSDYRTSKPKMTDASTSTDDIPNPIDVEVKSNKQDVSVGVNLQLITCCKIEHEQYCLFKNKQNYGIGTKEMRYDHLLMELQYMTNSRDSYKTMYEDVLKDLDSELIDKHFKMDNG
jgi:metal-sulfur cluster biosynthetic enzyme